ncbi:MAG TPA: hypothetical protein VHE14_05340 [Solirubrobacteraceae bacterium]|nr:hypothetical protein [Solirubrobacteraceae bacterium]
MGRKTRLVVAAAIAAATVFFIPPARAAQTGVGEPYGLVAVAGNLLPGHTLAERSANYRRLFQAGVRAIRLDINWVQVQPPGAPPDRFDFSERDREVRAITDAGLKVIGILAYGNPDYSSLGKQVAQTPVSGGLPPFGVGSAQYFPPDDPADFARYARRTAEHYSGDVVAWEVWNEENEGYRFWPPHEDPAAYARLLCATYPQVKAIAPDVPVLFGGVFFPAAAGAPGMSGVDFVEAAYAADPRLTSCSDAVAYHPYAYTFTSPELDLPVRGSVLSAADQMRAVLARHGDGAKPVWITEVGWPTHDRAYGVPEAKQAQYLARMQAATFAQGVRVLTWYTYGDDADPSGVNQEAHFGLFRADNTPKPAYEALRTFGRVFAGTSFAADRSRELGLPPGQQYLGGRGFALEYRRPGARITALWVAPESAADGQGPVGAGSAAPASLKVSLPVTAATVTVVDYLGGERTLAAAGGAVALDLGPGPIYVVDGEHPPAAAAACQGSDPPRSSLRRRALRLSRRRLRVDGRAGGGSCAGQAAGRGIARVDVAVARVSRRRCRFVGARGRLGPPRSCRRPLFLAARGTSSWRLALRARLPRGRYSVRSRALDDAGNVERPARANKLRLRVR